MTPGAIVALCSACGWRGLPERVWCPSCGSERLREARVHAGTVTEVTTVRRVVGAPKAPVRLGEVTLAGGGVLVARLEPGAAAGVPVRLFDDEGATVARPAGR